LVLCVLVRFICPCLLPPLPLLSALRSVCMTSLDGNPGSSILQDLTPLSAHAFSVLNAVIVIPAPRGARQRRLFQYGRAQAVDAKSIFFLTLFTDGDFGAGLRPFSSAVERRTDCDNNSDYYFPKALFFVFSASFSGCAAWLSKFASRLLFELRVARKVHPETSLSSPSFRFIAGGALSRPQNWAV